MSVKDKVKNVYHPLDLKTAQLDDILLEKLKRAFHKTTSTVYLHNVAKIALEHSPIDLAVAASRIPLQDRSVLYENLKDLDDKVTFIIETDGDTRTAVLRQIDDHELKELLEYMPLDEAVSMTEDLSARRFRKILDKLDVKKALQIKELVKHEPKSAARLMKNEYFLFTPDKTIKEVAKIISNYPGVEMTKRIFVVNEQKQLVGYVPARNLIVNDSKLPLKKIMRPVYHKVNQETSREEIVDVVERYKISSLPVVDRHNVLLGVITYEDVIEAIGDIADETIATIGGTNEKLTDSQRGIKRFFARAPWLLVTLIAGLINMEVMEYYNENTPHFLTFLLFFVPLITGLSGNIGLQNSTVLVRYMALNMITKKNRKNMALKELVLGMSTGVIFGIGAGLIVFFLSFMGVHNDTVYYPAAIGLIISGGLISACIAGTFLGVFSPLVFANIGIDPAVAAGPIITAFNDFLSMVIYFIVATFLTGLLI